MGSAILTSVRDYLQTSYEPPCEFVEGKVIPKPMPTWQHGLIQVWIGALIMRLFPQYAASAEVRARLSKDEYRLPDVLVDLRSKVTGPYPESPAHLCIEIVSPEDRLNELFAKCERYHAWGVPYCWIVDPQERRAWLSSPGKQPEETMTLTAQDIVIPLHEVFSILDSAQ